MNVATRNGSTLQTIPKHEDFLPWINNRLMVRYLASMSDDGVLRYEAQIISLPGEMPHALRARIGMFVGRPQVHEPGFLIDFVPENKHVAFMRWLEDWYQEGSEEHRFRIAEEAAHRLWVTAEEFVGVVRIQPGTRKGSLMERATKVAARMEDEDLFVPFTAYACAVLQRYVALLEGVPPVSESDKAQRKGLKILSRQFSAFAATSLISTMNKHFWDAILRE